MLTGPPPKFNGTRDILDVEYRTGLVQHLLPLKQSRFGGANIGAFAGPDQWRPGGSPITADQWGEVPEAERRFRDDYSHTETEAWDSLFGDLSLDDVLANYRSTLEKYQRYR